MRTALALLLFAPLLAFGQVSFTGSLDPTDANSVVLITFHLVNPTTVTARSWGAGGSAGAPGGRNAEGTVIAPGGFDPYFSLFAGTGPTATLLATNDDGACPPGTPVGVAPGVCLDSSLVNINLPAGDYTLAVSMFLNMSFAENNGTDPLGAGFVGLAVNDTSRTFNYAVDLFGSLLVTDVRQVTSPGIITFPAPPITGGPAPLGPPSAYQIRYAANLNVDDGMQAVVNITNTGTASSLSFPVQNGDMCVSAYAFSPDEQMISCCACAVTPNGLAHLSVKNDFATNTLTPIVPTAVVVELVATRRTGLATCDPGTFSTIAQLSEGMVAWGSTLHAVPATPGTPGTYGLTETPFSKATLGQGQLNRLAQLCSFIRANGSGYGICKSCRVGGLGASAK